MVGQFNRPQGVRTALKQTNLTRREFTARGGALALAGLVPGVLSACGSGSKVGDSLEMFVSELPLQLTGQRQLISGAGSILIALEPLVTVDDKGTIVPNLAQSFEVVDRHTLVFHVRQGVRFWDGTLLTPDDVAFSLDMHRTDSSSILQRWWYLAESVKRQGEDRVVVKLTQPYAGFLYVVAQTPIVQMAYAKRHGQSVGTPATLNMGTGAWRFKSFNPDHSVELVANDKYWGEKPQYRRIITRMAADASTAALAIKTGEMTGNLMVPVAAAATYEKLGGVHVDRRKSLEVCVITMNTGYAPWNDLHVRRAVQHAVNREACVQGALGGHGQSELSIVSEQALRAVMPTDQVDALLREITPQIAFDLDRAKAELAKSAFPKGFDVGTVIDNEPEIITTLQLIAADLRKIGINLTIKQAPSSVYENQYGSRQYSLGSYTVHPDTGDPLANVIGSAFDKAGVTKTGNGPNSANYTTPQLQRLLERLRATPPEDRAKRGELCAELVRFNASQALYIGVWSPQAILAIDDRYRYPSYTELWWQTRWPTYITKG
ncbi:MAG TPA: ABC transporter substrate-binding protein [Conexibacter sp.]|jgi:peptide/nickel transport system substrate-binding protein|nr:ABC transporter substrate-binding protein [Conexibacter sp.]